MFSPSTIKLLFLLSLILLTRQSPALAAPCGKLDLSGTYLFESKKVNCDVLKVRNSSIDMISADFPNVPLGATSIFFVKGTFTLVQNACESIEVQVSAEDGSVGDSRHLRPLRPLATDLNGLEEKVTIDQGNRPKFTLSRTIESDDVIGKNKETTTWVYQIDAQNRLQLNKTEKLKGSIIIPLMLPVSLIEIKCIFERK